LTERLIPIILLLSIIFIPLNADKLDDRFDKELENLTPMQFEVMQDSFNKGSVFNLSWTMTAIAWQESNFGENRVGRTTPDYGVYQININTFKKRYSDIIKKHKHSDKLIIKMLKYNDALNFSASVTEVQYWLSVYKGNYYKTWSSYNGGWKGCTRYADIIKKRIKALKKFMAKKHQEYNLC